MSLATVTSPVATATIEGLSQVQKTLPAWLFYDDAGSQLFEQITELPEYYLTRTERDLLATHAADILTSEVTIAELGAGTAAKTGILLRAAAAAQPGVLYQPIDISPSALDEACQNLDVTGVVVRPQVANYITEPYRIVREAHRRVLALYIGSSIGNFSHAEAQGILANLRTQLEPGDSLLLGTDLAPGPHKPVSTLLAAYDDAAGATAAFNRNVLTRLNRELGANFDLDCFRHQARWNEAESRIEMHLESLAAQSVTIPGQAAVHFRAGETIHTENSRKFTLESLAGLLESSGYRPVRTFTDAQAKFAVTLAEAR